MNIPLCHPSYSNPISFYSLLVQTRVNSTFTGNLKVHFYSVYTNLYVCPQPLSKSTFAFETSVEIVIMNFDLVTFYRVPSLIFIFSHLLISYPGPLEV